MLREAWDYWRADCAPGARRIGLAGEAVALAARSRRQQFAWRTHLENSRRQILAVAGQASHGTIIVLGSGSCLDVPVAELAAMFDRVVLADAVQLAASRRLARRYRNVELRTIDVSGSMLPLLGLPPPITDSMLDSLSFRAPADALGIEGADCVVSVNLLSQLPLPMADWLQRLRDAPSMAAINRYSWRVIGDHLAMLRQARGRVLLIADSLQRSVDAAGNVTAETRPLAPLALDARVREHWQWPVAPPGERSDGETTTHEVAAIAW